MTSLQIDHLTSPDALLVDDDTRDGVMARRNVLLGLWIATRLGLTGPDAEAYAWSVYFSDFDQPGHDDVIAKVAADLSRHGIMVPERSLRRNLHEMEARAELQLAVDTQ